MSRKVSASDRIEKILSQPTNFSARFFADYSELVVVLSLLRAMGKVIVQTSGVFDILHSGHALYLEKARELGDVLVVGVDVDEWVRKRKGLSRPVIPFEARVEILAHFRHVDILTLQFGHLHEIVRPNILVASESTDDLTEEAKEEMRKYCGQLVCLPPQAKINSTAIITQMNESSA